MPSFDEVTKAESLQYIVDRLREAADALERAADELCGLEKMEPLRQPAAVDSEPPAQ